MSYKKTFAFMQTIFLRRAFAGAHSFLRRACAGAKSIEIDIDQKKLNKEEN